MYRDPSHRWRKDNPKDNAGIILLIFAGIIPFISFVMAWCIAQLCQEECLRSKIKKAIGRFRSDLREDIRHLREAKKQKREDERRSCLCMLGEPCVMEKHRR